MVLYFLML